MKMLCCYTATHRVLFHDFFAATLPSDVELEAFPLPEIAGTGDFHSRGFFDCIRRKLELILESLQRHDGEIVIWSDVDILFFRPIGVELSEFLERQNLDIAFQREARGGTPEVNTGFFVCLASARVAAFFQQVIDHLERHPSWDDQIAANDLLAHGIEGDLRWGQLPGAYYARTHGWPPPRELALYHANETKGHHGVAQKIAQFKEVSRIRRYGAVAVALSCVAKIPKRLLRLWKERIRRANPPNTRPTNEAAASRNPAW